MPEKTAGTQPGTRRPKRMLSPSQKGSAARIGDNRTV